MTRTRNISDLLESDGDVKSTHLDNAITDVAGDSSPQLAADLDLNSNNITGTGNINTTGTVTASGTITGASFSGSGSALTGLPAANLTGTLPAIDGSALTGINTDLVSDITPQLGGNLDTNGKRIEFEDSAYITGSPGLYTNRLEFGDGHNLRIYADSGGGHIYATETTNLSHTDAGKFRVNNGVFGSGYKQAANFDSYAECSLGYNGSLKFVTTSGGATVTGTLTATSFSGDGSSLTGIAAGATGGGNDQIFYENGQTVTTNYTITNGKNAMSAGPITINSGVTVTVGTGETWTVV